MAFQAHIGTQTLSEHHLDTDLEAAVTIGDRAEAESPIFRTGVRRIHWAIDDPANADGTADSEAVFRWTMHQIEQCLPALAELLAAIPPRQDCIWAPATSTTIFRARGFDPARHVPLCSAAGFHNVEYEGPLMLEVCPGPELDPKTELEKCRQALDTLGA